MDAYFLLFSSNNHCSNGRFANSNVVIVPMGKHSFDGSNRRCLPAYDNVADAWQLVTRPLSTMPNFCDCFISLFRSTIGPVSSPTTIDEPRLTHASHITYNVTINYSVCRLVVQIIQLCFRYKIWLYCYITKVDVRKLVTVSGRPSLVVVYDMIYTRMHRVFLFFIFNTGERRRRWWGWSDGVGQTSFTHPFALAHTCIPY